MKNGVWKMAATVLATALLSGTAAVLTVGAGKADQDSIDKVEARVKKNEATDVEIKERLARIETTQDTVKEDVNEVKEDVTEVKNDVKEILRRLPSN